MAKKGQKSIKLIGALKLAKGVLLVLAAAAVFGLLHRDIASIIQALITNWHFDPTNKYFKQFASKMFNLSPKFPLVVAGFASYGALFCLEGVGLLFEKRWAEYLTVIATTSFLPLEGYEMIRQPSVSKGVVIVVNAAIVVWLIIRLKRDKPDH